MAIARKLSIKRAGKTLNISRFSRHGRKTKKGKLSLYGAIQALAEGTKLPIGYFPVSFSSEKERAQTTAKLSRIGHGYWATGKAGVKNRKRQVKVRKELFDREGLNKNWEQMEELIQKTARERRVSLERAESILMKQWLEGKGTKTIPPYSKVADPIIRKRLGLGQRVSEWKGRKRFRKLLLENVSHSWILEAVFTRLTGRISRDVMRGSYIGEAKGYTVHHLQDGRLLLERNKEIFDITENYRQIAKRQ